MNDQHDERPGVGTGSPGPSVRLADGPVERFLAGVRSALADLPAAEVDEILDDVRAHVADLAAELGPDVDQATVVGRLGTPAAYATELRTAAGYPPAPQPVSRPRSGPSRLAVVGLVAGTVLIPLGLLAGAPETILLGLLAPLVALPALVKEGPRMAGVAALPEVRRLVAARSRSGSAVGGVVDFVASLQPAWWVLRGVLAAFIVGAVLLEPYPVLVLPLALVAVLVSVWLGRWSRADRRWVWVVVPLNGLAVALLLTGAAINAGPSPDYSGEASAYRHPGLWQDSEREILDIRPVDANGVPLSGIYLFDQDGQPIDARDDWCDDSYYYEGPSTARPVEPYPRGTAQTDLDTGRCVRVPPGPLVVAVPPVPTTGSATVVPPPPVSGLTATPSPPVGGPTTAPPSPVPPTAATPTG